MTQINAYLTSNGNCREAMTFYQACLGGELSMQPVEGSPMENEMPVGAKQKILHASLKKDSLVLLGSDMAGPEGIVKGNTNSLCLNCYSENEIKAIFSHLSALGHNG